MEQRIGPDNEPFAQRSPLGWTIIGDTCLSRQHIPKTAKVYKTFVTERGPGSILKPCSQYLLVKKRFSNRDLVYRLCDSKCDENLFKRTSDDNTIGTSVEDRMSMDIMDKELVIGEDGKWVTPLPFRQPMLQLPNNYEISLRRALALDASLKKNPRKRATLQRL